MTLDQLLGSIDTSTKLLEKLKELFVVHENSMKNRDLDALEDSNTQLAEHLMLIKDNFDSRIDIQRQLCPELTEENWKKFIESQDESTQDAIAKAWDRLDKALEEVQQLNQVNQQIVRRGQRQIDELVSILQGKGKVNRVYDQRGGSGHLNTQKTLGKA